MPLTAAEKMKRRREKLKLEGKYEDYKEKQKLACRKSRNKKKNAIESLNPVKKRKEIEKQRKKIKERVAKHRLLKMNQQNSLDESSSSSLITPQTIGKAVSRVRKVLPRCVNKKQVILRKLLHEATSNEVSNALPVETSGRTSRLHEDTVRKIHEFYERDDTSRQSPGLKDCILIRKDNGEKDKVQCRHLVASISETHSMFVLEYGHIVGRSKFAALRPKHVRLSNKLPHNVCLCKYHENFSLAVNALHFIVDSPKYDHNFISSFICDIPTLNCWLYECEVCKELLQNKLNNYLQACEMPPTEVKWYIWKDCDGKLGKVQETGTVAELIQHVVEMAPSFFEHAYVKRNQAAAYNIDRMAISGPNYDPYSALIQVDYSENYTCIAQDEIQSYHWVQPQVTLFTASVWFSGTQHPIVIVSDDRHHDKKTAIIYIDKILEQLPKHVKTVNLWSDGPASQFKNRFVIQAMQILEERHEIHLVWNYFATSHGKGPVDGIGGALKRTVRNQVMKRRAIVTNAKEFANAAKDSKVKVINVTPQEIETSAKELNLNQYFENSQVIPGISKCHIMFWESKTLQKARISQDFNKRIIESTDSDDDNIPLAQLRIRQ